eukprot:TRINITY_DN5940_c0_g1_i1.p1 TRINITY_DN5940_c0_g1~~TRINITY_DN5940_c0_g1_i1.p1  ORF type:complete len:660 (+),score=285.80 TRINITY_DN5940_c0_g1_i1:127-2106(+)
MNARKSTRRSRKSEESTLETPKSKLAHLSSSSPLKNVEETSKNSMNKPKIPFLSPPPPLAFPSSRSSKGSKNGVERSGNSNSGLKQVERRECMAINVECDGSFPSFYLKDLLALPPLLGSSNGEKKGNKRDKKDKKDKKEKKEKKTKTKERTKPKKDSSSPVKVALPEDNSIQKVNETEDRKRKFEDVNEKEVEKIEEKVEEKDVELDDDDFDALVMEIEDSVSKLEETDDKVVNPKENESIINELEKEMMEEGEISPINQCIEEEEATVDIPKIEEEQETTKELGEIEEAEESASPSPFSFPKAVIFEDASKHRNQTVSYDDICTPKSNANERRENKKKRKIPAENHQQDRKRQNRTAEDLEKEGVVHRIVMKNHRPFDLEGVQRTFNPRETIKCSCGKWEGLFRHWKNKHLDPYYEEERKDYDDRQKAREERHKEKEAKRLAEEEKANSQTTDWSFLLDPSIDPTHTSIPPSKPKTNNANTVEKEEVNERRTRSRTEGQRKREEKPKPKPKVICKFFMNGACKAGDECTFLHEGSPPKKEEICKFFKTGSCLKGEECVFSHDLKTEPCKYFQVGNCTNKDCPYGHFIAPVQPKEPEKIEEVAEAVNTPISLGHTSSVLPAFQSSTFSFSLPSQYNLEEEKLQMEAMERYKAQMNKNP